MRKARRLIGGVDALFLLAALLSLLPMLATIPGMADLPNHIARHAVLAGGEADPLAHYWAIRWKWTGNLGVDLPAVALTRLMGAEAATRLVVATIAPLTVLGILLLGRAVHGRATAGAAMALPFALCQPYLYGFANYCLSIALALLVAAWWIERLSLPGSSSEHLPGAGRGPDAQVPAGERSAFDLNSPRLGPGLRREGAFSQALLGILLSLLVFTAHIMGWAVLLLIVGGVELSRLRYPADVVAVARRNWPLLAPLAPLLLWRGEASGPAYVWTAHVLQSKAMIVATVLKGLVKPLDLAMTGIAFAVIAVAWLRRWIDPGLAAAAALLFLAALALPTTVLGSWGADLRLMPYAPMLALLAIRPLARRRDELALLGLGLALFAVRVGTATALWLSESANFEQRLAILDRVPAGSRMGFLVVEPCGTPWRLSPDRKLGSYAVVRRHAFTNTLFQIPGADLILMRSPEDRARWFDGSQDVDGCDEAHVAQQVQERLTTMVADGFDTVWLVDAPVMTVPPGFAVTHPSARDTLLTRHPRESGDPSRERSTNTAVSIGAAAGDGSRLSPG